MESYRVTRKCVVAFAIAIFVLGWVVALPPAAAAKGGYLAYNAATHTYTVKPNGVDDTANIQAAFDGCASSSSRCTVQLTKGTFYTAQIVAHEFRGSFLGMGEGRTIVQALPNLPSPTADPFWTVQPGPQNPWPDMFVFLNGSFAVTAMTLSEPYDVPTQGWFCCGLPAIDALHAAIMITGEHADVAIEHVTVQGAAGDFLGFNMLNGIYYEGFLPKPGWTNPYVDVYLITGTFVAAESTFNMIIGSLAFENLAEARVTARFNTFDNSPLPLSAYDVSNSTVVFAGNRATNVGGAGFAGVQGFQGIYLTNLWPSRIFVTNNAFQVTNGAAGVLLIDFEATPTLSAVVSGNEIQTDSTSAGGVISMSLRSTVVTGNEIHGAGPVGVYMSGGAGAVAGNEIRGSVVGVELDGATGVLARGNEITDSGQWGIAVIDGSTNNRIAKNEVTNSGTYDLYWDGLGTGNLWRHNEYTTSYPPNLSA